jgi:hypothetical protein
VVLRCLPSRCSASGSMRCGKTDALISSACAPAGARAATTRRRPLHRSGQLLAAGLKAFGEWRAPLGCLPPWPGMWITGIRSECGLTVPNGRTIIVIGVSKRSGLAPSANARGCGGTAGARMVKPCGLWFFGPAHAGLGQNDGVSSRVGFAWQRPQVPAPACRRAAAPAAAASRDRRLIPPPDAPAPGSL